MNSSNQNHDSHSHVPSKYTLKNFLPLIIIFLLISSFTLISQWFSGWNSMKAMSDFMAGFFLVFGSFKLLKIHAFAQAYATYDIIAKRSSLYAYTYPFIELFIGVAYLLRLWPVPINLATFLLMTVSSIGVALELAKGKTIVCACLGTVFKIPMTYVTLLEDVVMGLMALLMLFLA